MRHLDVRACAGVWGFGSVSCLSMFVCLLDCLFAFLLACACVCVCVCVVRVCLFGDSEQCSQSKPDFGIAQAGWAPLVFVQVMARLRPSPLASSQALTLALSKRTVGLQHPIFAARMGSS